MDEGKGREAFQSTDTWSLVTYVCVDIIAPDSLLWVREQHRCCCAVAAILGVHRSDSAQTGSYPNCFAIWFYFLERFYVTN